VTKEPSSEADYYRACAAEMMAKAQAAPSKATRRAYLNLAIKWSRQAQENLQSPADEAGPCAASQPPAPPKQN
jgi:hypothetical protein